MAVNQEQYDKARKAGYTDAQIAAEMNKYATPAPSVPTPTVTLPTPQPIVNTPVNGNTMDTSTGAPYVAPTTPSPTPSPINTPGVRSDGKTFPDSSTQATAPGTPSSTTGIDASPGIMTYEELSQDMRDYLDNNPLAKQQFDLVATQGKQNQDKYLMDAEKAVVEWKKQKDYNAGQTANTQAQMALVQGSNLRNAQQTMDKATQNTYYSAVSPISSGSQQTAATGQLREMATKLDEMVALNGLQNDAFATQTAEQARRIQLDLDTKLGQVLSDKLKAIDNGVANGTIATPEQLDRIFKENSAAILKEVPQLTNFAVQQMSDLTSNFMNTQKELRDNQITFNQNKQKIEASPAGFYVDGNGNPVVDAQGNQIKAPPNQIKEPQFIEETGQMITFGLDEFGNLDVQAHDVAGFKAKPKAQEEKWKPLPGVPGKLYDPVTGETKNADGSAGPNVEETGSTPYTPPTGFESRGAGASIQVKNTGDGIEIGIPSGTKLEGVGGQCGGLVNDFASSIQGYKRVGDTWESKLANKNSMQPVAGGLVMWTPGTFEDNGHIGIVEKVFADGSFQIYDTNYVAANTTSRRTIKPGDKEYNLIQKTGGFFDPSKVGGQGGQEGGTYDETDIAVFNSLTPTAKKKMQNDPQYNQYIKDYTSVMRDKDATIEDILRYSAGSKPIGDKEGERLVKFDQALSQVSDMETQITKMKTGPIIGRLRNLNPYDTDAQTLKAQLQALIPNLARGVYGEVGVLTDQDIVNYAKTIPNLKSTNDVNDAVLAMTLKVLANGYKKQLQSLATAKNDVSGFEGTYYQYMDRVKEIEEKLGIQGDTGTTGNSPASTNNTNPLGI